MNRTRKIYDSTQNSRREEKKKAADDQKKADIKAALKRLDEERKSREMQRLATEAARMKPKGF